MAWTHEYPAVATVEARTEEAMRVPIGVASPLWFMFGAAASAGVAYWWMTRLARAANIEALAPLPAKLLGAPTLVEVATAPALAAMQAADALEAATPDPAAIEALTVEPAD